MRDGSRVFRMAAPGSRDVAPSARNAGHEVDPEKAIPFDEEESFKDF